MMDTLLDPKIWLILVALVHAIVGVIIPTDWSKDNNKMMSGFILLTSITMLYAGFCLDGEEQARLALVIGGPIWVWFVVCCAMELEFETPGNPNVFDNSLKNLLFWTEKPWNVSGFFRRSFCEGRELRRPKSDHVHPAFSCFFPFLTSQKS